MMLNSLKEGVMMRDEMMKKKRWRIASGVTTIEESLAEGLGVNPVVAHLLVNRGITTVEEGKAFLCNTLEDLLDPFALKGMPEAVEEISRVMNANGHIVVYGDYDVDGITATSLVYRCLTSLGANVSYYIPERQSEGYGLNLEALEGLIERGVDLVLTVDCGISSYDIVEAVKERVAIIITDHHMAPPEVPQATAVINHKQVDCTYADKNLSGAGVAFKFCQALWKTLKGELYMRDLDIVALGTVADVVPLVGENRILVREGLRKINESPNLGIKALISVAGLEDKQVTAGHIGFTLAPRLNAAGRVTHATRAVELLVTESPELAREIAEELQETNTERQQIERAIFEEAHRSVLEQGTDAQDVIVVAGEGWHPGVIGIVASRLVEAFYKPTMVISIHDGVGKGSCRSIDNCNMYDMLKSAEDLLLQFGGHHQAAGFSIQADRIDDLRRAAASYCQSHLKAEDYVPIVDIDGELEPSDVTVELIDQISTLEPYGMGNSTPIFSISDIAVQNVYRIGFHKNHIKFILQGSDGPLDAILWQGAALFKEVFNDDRVRLAFSLQKNEWNQKVFPQLMIQDISTLEDEQPRLTTEGLREMYLVVKQIFHGPTAPEHVVTNGALQNHPPSQTNREAMLALDVFKELGLLKEEYTDDGRLLYRWQQATGKLDLVTSLTFLKYGG